MVIKKDSSDYVLEIMSGFNVNPDNVAAISVSNKEGHSITFPLTLNEAVYVIKEIFTGVYGATVMKDYVGKKMTEEEIRKELSERE